MNGEDIGIGLILILVGLGFTFLGLMVIFNWDVSEWIVTASDFIINKVK